MKTLLVTAIPLTLVAMIALQGDYGGVNGGLGSTPCTACHSDGAVNQPPGRQVYEEWLATAHGTAFDAAPEVVQNSARCLTCHTTGFDSTMANKGSDDWISWTNYTSGTFNVSFDDSASFGALTNVQCESCHGPASDHTMNPGMKPELDLSAENCGQCHQDAHHPYLEEWSLSKHSLSLMDHLSPALANLARTSPECSGCHTVQGFIQFVGETSQDSTNIMPDVTPPGDAAVELVCAACHDPHPGVQHDSQLRLPKADLCVKCHNPEDAQPPDTPHHATSSMWDGVGAVEFPGFDQGKKQSTHQFVAPEKCVTCHVFATEFVSEEEPAGTGHTFEPRLEACAQCHAGSMTVTPDTIYFNDVGPNGPFDYKDRQTKTIHLVDSLHALLEDASTSDSLTATFENALFNLHFVESSGSWGVHNANYAEEILLRTIDGVWADFNFGVGIEADPSSDVPREFALHQNYPNPFNPATTIRFDVPQEAHVVLAVYNVLGQRVVTLVDERMSPSSYTAQFDAGRLSSGVYFYSLQAGSFRASREMMLVK